MDGRTWQRIEEIFFEALERPEGERTAFLDAACLDSPELREELDAMLAVHADDAQLRVERVLLDTARSPEESALLADEAGRGRRIGPWRLERLLGRGGMGEVWLVARADGTYEATAALKLVRPGWRAAQLIPRFRRERQLLAHLRHPHIATLLDGGVTEEGLPYLVMEYVDGEPVTTWCASHQLGVRERLTLFRTICEAVSFAHAKLVIHRDLKPQNILVTRDGRPILLDFGIAKLLDPDEAEAAPTLDEDRALTPEHAAPEQMRGEPVTTATDVWGLGVLLYELLSGRRPFVRQGSTPADLQLRVQREDPPSPSAAAPERETARRLRGDLDRIVMKALRKEPDRRYRSAEELVEDIDRWLTGMPVRATPDSLGYRARKLLRRQRVALSAAAAILTLLVTFAITSAWQARRVRHERDKAVAERRDAEAAITMLVDLFRVADPRITPGGDTLRVDRLVQLAEERIEQTRENPRIQAKLWGTLANIHAGRSRLEAQGRALERALAAAEQAGLADESLRLRHEQAMLIAWTKGATEAEPLLRRSLLDHERRYGASSHEVATACADLAGVLVDANERGRLLERALAIHRTKLASAVASDSLGLAAVHNALGSHHWSQREPTAAAEAFQAALQLLERVLPPDHPDVLSVRSNVAVCLQAAGRFRESEAMHRELLASRRRVVGPRTAAAAGSLQGIAVALVNQGRHAEAAELLREAVDIAREVFGSAHANLDWYARELGLALAHSGRWEEAGSVLDSVRAAVAARHGEASWQSADLAVARARAELAAGQPAPMDSLRLAVARLRQQPSEPKPGLATALIVLGSTALASPGQARAGEAEAAFTEAVQLLAPQTPPGHPLLSAARLGQLVAQAQAAAGATVDRSALAATLEGCKDWGLADPGVLRHARGLLGAPH